MGLGLRRVGEQARRLDDHLRAEFLPGNACGVALGGDLNLAPVDDERACPGLNVARVDAVVAVVLEQVRVGGGVEQVVDGDHLDVVGMTVEQRFEGLATDAAKAVDAYAYCHWWLLFRLVSSHGSRVTGYEVRIGSRL